MTSVKSEPGGDGDVIRAPKKAMTSVKSEPGGDSDTVRTPKRARTASLVDSSSSSPLRVQINPADCDLDFDIDGNGCQGHALHEKGFAYCWSGARATVGIIGGRYCFGCKIIGEQTVDMSDTPPDQQHVCRVGVSRGDDPVGKLGETNHSFGFGGTGKFSNAGKFSDYGQKFGIGDTIVCAVNLEEKPLGLLEFSKNGNCLGIARHFDVSQYGIDVAGASQQKSHWKSVLFPHILLKNVVVQLQFSVEDGLVPMEGYKPWSSAIEDGKAITGPIFSSPNECEVMMMVGLPASGKTTWAERRVKDHPEKRYVLLGTNLALDQMKVPGLLRKQNYGERFDRLMDRATGIFNTWLARAAKRPRNYILDQTNVYRSARLRKMKAFVHYRKVAVVVFPTPNELKLRADKRFKEMGKEVPAEAVNEMLENFVIPRSKDMPVPNELFDEVIFPELERSEAQRHLDEMKRELTSPNINSKKDYVSSYSRENSVQSFSTSSVTKGDTSDAHMQNYQSPVSLQRNKFASPSPSLPQVSTARSRDFGSKMRDSGFPGPDHCPQGNYSTYGGAYPHRDDINPFGGKSGPDPHFSTSSLGRSTIPMGEHSPYQIHNRSEQNIHLGSRGGPVPYISSTFERSSIPMDESNQYQMHNASRAYRRPEYEAPGSFMRVNSGYPDAQPTYTGSFLHDYGAPQVNYQNTEPSCGYPTPKNYGSLYATPPRPQSGMRPPMNPSYGSWRH